MYFLVYSRDTGVWTTEGDPDLNLKLPDGHHEFGFWLLPGTGVRKRSISREFQKKQIIS